jgi:hypothetical protein
LRNEARGLLRIRLLDMLGREIYRETCNSSPTDLSIRPGAPPGMYVLSLSNGEFFASQKIVLY